MANKTYPEELFHAMGWAVTAADRDSRKDGVLKKDTKELLAKAGTLLDAYMVKATLGDKNG